MTERKRVLIVHTGGTIGMRRGAGGYRPEPGFLAEQMAAMPTLGRPELPDYSIRELTPLLDSANMTPAEWVAIGREIAEGYDEFDGFIVLHGTDTMAYSASAVSFILAPVGKPVVFTGSQIPLQEVRSDARDNLITSMLIAAHHPVPEVCLFFGDRLFRGNRVVKVTSSGLRAFDSPNFPPLGTAGVAIEIDWSLVRPRAEGTAAPRLTELGPAKVGVLKLFPGISPEVVANVLAPPVEGVVLETYGVGNAPADPALLAAIAAATARGVVVVNCTQCLRGAVDMDHYATGHALREAGVTSGYDMTSGAALAKLIYLLSLDLDPAEIRRRVQQDLRGELTPPATERDV